MTDSLLENYNPLYDVHLRQYFALPHMQKHLRKMGLVDSEGRVVDGEGAVYARHHMMMDMMLKNREQQLIKLSDLQKKLDAAEKVEIYRRIRSGQSPESFRRTKASRSLSRGRNSQGNSSRQRRFSNSFDDKEIINKIETANTEATNYNERDPYARLSAKASKYRYLHKLDDSTLIKYKDQLKRELDRLERFRAVSFGVHSVARQPPTSNQSWFFRRRSLPSLTQSAPANALHEPLRSINSLRGRKANVSPRGNRLNQSHDSRTSCPPTVRQRRNSGGSNPRLPPIPKKQVSKSAATQPPRPVKLPPAQIRSTSTRTARKSRERAVSKKETTTPNDKLPQLAAVGVGIGAIATTTAVVAATNARSETPTQNEHCVFIENGQQIDTPLVTAESVDEPERLATPPTKDFEHEEEKDEKEENEITSTHEKITIDERVGDIPIESPQQIKTPPGTPKNEAEEELKEVEHLMEQAAQSLIEEPELSVRNQEMDDDEKSNSSEHQISSVSPTTKEDNNIIEELHEAPKRFSVDNAEETRSHESVLMQEKDASEEEEAFHDHSGNVQLGTNLEVHSAEEEEHEAEHTVDAEHEQSNEHEENTVDEISEKGSHHEEHSHVDIQEIEKEQPEEHEIEYRKSDRGDFHQDDHTKHNNEMSSETPDNNTMRHHESNEKVAYQETFENRSGASSSPISDNEIVERSELVEDEPHQSASPLHMSEHGEELAPEAHKQTEEEKMHQQDPPEAREEGEDEHVSMTTSPIQYNHGFSIGEINEDNSERPTEDAELGEESSEKHFTREEQKEEHNESVEQTELMQENSSRTNVEDKEEDKMMSLSPAPDHSIGNVNQLDDVHDTEGTMKGHSQSGAGEEKSPEQDEIFIPYNNPPVAESNDSEQEEEVLATRDHTSPCPNDDPSSQLACDHEHNDVTSDHDITRSESVNEHGLNLPEIMETAASECNYNSDDNLSTDSLIIHDDEDTKEEPPLGDNNHDGEGNYAENYETEETTIAKPEDLNGNLNSADPMLKSFYQVESSEDHIDIGDHIEAGSEVGSASPEAAMSSNASVHPVVIEEDFEGENGEHIHKKTTHHEYTEEGVTYYSHSESEVKTRLIHAGSKTPGSEREDDSPPPSPTIEQSHI